MEKEKPARGRGVPEKKKFLLFWFTWGCPGSASLGVKWPQGNFLSTKASCPQAEFHGSPGESCNRAATGDEYDICCGCRATKAALPRATLGKP
jgi:hypothetical protein